MLVIPQRSIYQKPFPFIFLLMLFLGGCETDDGTDADPEPVTTLLNIEVTENLNTANRDFYIFITDEEGKLLGYQELITGEKSEIIGEPLPSGEGITIHLAIASDGIGTVGSYTHLEPGSTWILDTAPSTFPSSITANVTNFPDPLKTQIWVSDLYQTNPYIGELTSDDGDNYSGSIELLYSQQATDVMISFTNGTDDPSYIMFEDVTSGEVYEVDYNQAKQEFDNVLEVVPGEGTSISLLYIYGTSQEAFDQFSTRGYLFGVVQGTNESAKIGFNNGLDVYETQNWETVPLDGDIYKNYVKVGAAPEVSDFSLPDKSFEVVNKNLNSLRFQTNDEFELQRSFFIEKDKPEGGFTWYVYSPIPYNTVPIFTDSIPEELESVIPPIEDMEYFSSYFMDYLDGQDYYDFVRFRREQSFGGRLEEFIRYFNTSN